jgi:hypothetical protein
MKWFFRDNPNGNSEMMGEIPFEEITSLGMQHALERAFDKLTDDWLKKYGKDFMDDLLKSEEFKKKLAKLIDEKLFGKEDSNGQENTRAEVK